MTKYFALALLGSTFFVSPVMADPATAQQMAPHWSYVGEGAAHAWGDLSEDYAACRDGKAQSPINIEEYNQTDLPELDVLYEPGPLEVMRDDHNIHVKFHGKGGLSVGDADYKLLQIHFHTPSEHYIGGSPFPMEAHFVHQNDEGELAVIGVMFKVGAANAELQKIWDHIPVEKGANKPDGFMFNPMALLPNSVDYFRYDGSLTTPPCTEGVAWHVLKTPLRISQDQLVSYQTLFPVNARPVQPLNERVVDGE